VPSATLELAYRTDGGYVDLAGRPVALDVPGRTATLAEHDGRGVAALLQGSTRSTQRRANARLTVKAELACLRRSTQGWKPYAVTGFGAVPASFGAAPLDETPQSGLHDAARLKSRIPCARSTP
jgi:hypothetical protein